MKYKLITKGPGDRTITVVGQAFKATEEESAHLTVGFAVKNPGDNTDDELGVIIASGRSIRNPKFKVYVGAERVNKDMLSTFTHACATTFVDNFYLFNPVSNKQESTQRIDGVSDTVMKEVV